MIEFRKDARGVHVMDASGAGSEYTLCGLAFDAHESGDSEDGPLVISRGPVTCRDCINHIKFCKSIRI